MEWKKVSAGRLKLQIEGLLDLWMKILESFDFCGKFGLLRIIWYTIKAI